MSCLFHGEVKLVLLRVDFMKFNQWRLLASLLTILEDFQPNDYASKHSAWQKQWAWNMKWNKEFAIEVRFLNFSLNVRPLIDLWKCMSSKTTSHASSSFVLKVYQSPFLKEKKGAHSKVQYDFLKTFTNFNLTFKHFQIPSINF